jgi:uncharacterized membrane protein YbhN (UPF0104 family)
VRTRIKATLKVLMRAGISIGLLSWLVAQSGPGDLLEAFLGISRQTWAAAFLMFLLSQLLAATRWCILARALDFAGRWSAYLKFYFVGMYFNLFLPSSVGGDVFRALFICQGKPLRLRAAYSVVADRLLGLTAMFMLGAAAVSAWGDLLPLRFETMLIASGLIAVALIAVLPFIHKTVSRVWSEIGERLSIILVFWHRPASLFSALGISLALQALGTGTICILANAMELSPPAAFYFAAFPLVALATLLPISFNGIGIREGGFVYFLGLKGVPVEKALTLSLSFFAIQVVTSLLGGLIYVLGLHKKT